MLHQDAKRVERVGQGPIKISGLECRSDQIIYKALFDKKRILVVCMAGRNRSTATLLRFLMLHSLSHPKPKEPEILLEARTHGSKKLQPSAWSLDEWIKWMEKKREFEIFPINMTQLERTAETMKHLGTMTIRKGFVSAKTAQ